MPDPTSGRTVPQQDLEGFLSAFRLLQEAASQHQQADDGQLLIDCLDEHLGTRVADLPVLTERVPNHRFVDWDVATALVAGPDHREVGVRTARGMPGNLRELLTTPYLKPTTGQVDYVHLATGVDSHRPGVARGLRLFTRTTEAGQVPVAIFQKQSDPRHGGDDTIVEVVSTDADVARDTLDEIRAAVDAHSVLRGQVVTFDNSGYGGPESAGLKFLPRPEVAATDVVLPAGVLTIVTDHVLGIADHAEILRAHHQHLKRGLLLYGPPGTGKTHTVRHLVAASPEHTVILLAGNALQAVHQATQMARSLQPAIIVLEDCDLIAEDRSFHGGVNPMLYSVLDAMDGLDGDADVAFLLTTNRVADLERALAQRPGRVDLAVEIDLPDRAGREQLVRLYGRDLALSDEVVTEVAGGTDGMTASFFKELVRRAVLAAAAAGEEPGDAHLRRARDGLLADGARLTRALLGEPAPLT